MRAWIVIGAMLLASPGWAQPPAEMARQQMRATVPDIILVDQDGRRFPLKQLRGKTMLLAFIYTSCHHVCPLIYESVSAVQKRVRSAGLRDVVAVFVTVDPEIDTPEVLKAYAGRRGADLSSAVFLTGAEAELGALRDAFGVKVKRLGRGLVDHPPLTFLVDARGVVRFRYFGEVLDAEAVVADLRNVMSVAERR